MEFWPLRVQYDNTGFLKISLNINLVFNHDNNMPIDLFINCYESTDLEINVLKTLDISIQAKEWVLNACTLPLAIS